MLLLRPSGVLGLLHEGRPLGLQAGARGACTVICPTLATQLAHNGDRVSAHSQPSRTTSKAVDSATTQYVLNLAATLPAVISDTEAVYLYGLDIIAQQEVLRRGSGQAPRLCYVHDGLGGVSQGDDWSAAAFNDTAH